MSDTSKRFHEVRKSLAGLFPNCADGNVARHLNTLTAMICGIVGSQRTNLPQVASQALAQGILQEILIKRFSRWVNNDQITQELYFLPYTEALLACFSHLPVTLVIDGSAVGRRCVALVISVVYKKRALPVAVLVRQGNKGHFAEEDHLELTEQVQTLIPTHQDVTFLGDGEFDGTALLKRIVLWDWHYVCRTAKNSLITKHGHTFQLQTRTVSQGQWQHFENVDFTQDAYGPVQAIIWWEKGYDEPLYLISNISKPIQAVRLYKRRFSIETLFSDQKSRGFHLHKSHLCDPARIQRLMIPTCLAYIWIVYLGIIAKEGGYVCFIHRLKRCDLSLFQLGLRMLARCFNEEEDLPEDIYIWEFGPFS